MKTKLFLIPGVIIMALMLAAFQFVDQKPWNVPDSAKQKKNPTTKSADNVNVGKGLYSKHCKSCHGKEGLGDGPKAAELETFPGDFSTSEVQNQTDGSLFYKIMEGREDMPGFKSKVDQEEDVWLIVQYMRTLKE